jgi:hypothetical protein
MRNYGAAITDQVDVSTAGSYQFIEMPLPPKRNRDGA